MNAPEQKTPQEELLRGLQVLMLLRVIFISFLLGALIFIQVRASRSYFGEVHFSHYLLLASVYALSILYVLWVRWSKNIRLQAYIQLLIDTLIITALIYTTGGIESIFSFLYILNIFSGSILLLRRGGMMVASGSSILYGLLLDLHYYGIVHPLASRLIYPDQYQSYYLFFTIAANMAAFYLVGYLSSFLSEQTKKSRAALQVKESDLTRLEILHESIISSLTSGLIVLDERKRIILFNPAAERMFGLASDQAFGHPIHDHLPCLAAQLNGPAATSRGISSLHPQPTDVTCPTADGRKMHLQVSISPLQYALSEQRGWILILQDVTRMREIQEEMKEVEGLALAGELAAGMAHEIRNPMASISGSIEMLKGDMEQNPVSRRLMDIILRETERLNELLADFLLFARTQKPRMTEFDLNQLIIDSLELFKNSQRCHSGIAIATGFQGPAVIESDPGQLKQVFWNLFLNASDGMRGRGGTLRVTSSLDRGSTNPQTGRVTVVVRDTGEGFDPNSLSRVFLPFFTTKERGSGLGLAIVKRIIDRLGGRISCRNHPGGGAEMKIVLPVRPTVDGDRGIGNREYATTSNP